MVIHFLAPATSKLCKLPSYEPSSLDQLMLFPRLHERGKKKSHIIHSWVKGQHNSPETTPAQLSCVVEKSWKKAARQTDLFGVIKDYIHPNIQLTYCGALKIQEISIVVQSTVHPLVASLVNSPCTQHFFINSKMFFVSSPNG